jgi:flavin-dependent dehydrogenase
MRMIRTDVLIVGGGPAGAACAGRLRELGVDCLILDRQVFPRTKPCAGWVTPQVFQSLKCDLKDYPHGLTRFSSFQVSIKGIKFRLPTRQFAIRRVEFDAWLLSRAGVDCVPHKVEKIQQTDSGFVIDDQFQANTLVGAGGTHCPVRRGCFQSSSQKREGSLILAKEEEFKHPVNDGRCHLWFFEDGLPGYAWVVPKTEGYLNIGIGASASGLKQRRRTLNEYWEAHLQRVQALGWVDNHTFNPAGYSYYLRQGNHTSQKGNIFLIGDALGLATKDMGEGIGPAIQSGILAAEAIKHETRYDTRTIPHFSFPSLLRW